MRQKVEVALCDIYVRKTHYNAAEVNYSSYKRLFLFTSLTSTSCLSELHLVIRQLCSYRRQEKKKHHNSLLTLNKAHLKENVATSTLTHVQSVELVTMETNERTNLLTL